MPRVKKEKKVEEVNPDVVAARGTHTAAEPEHRESLLGENVAATPADQCRVVALTNRNVAVQFSSDGFETVDTHVLTGSNAELAFENVRDVLAVARSGSA